jgi:hypothetical protein
MHFKTGFDHCGSLIHCEWVHTKFFAKEDEMLIGSVICTTWTVSDQKCAAVTLISLHILDRDQFQRTFTSDHSVVGTWWAWSDHVRLCSHT